MGLNVGAEVSALKRMTVGQLRARYAEVFGEQTGGHNKVWLVKRIAWRIQALAEGELSERARRRAAELARDADLRTTTPPERPAPAPADRHTAVLPIHTLTDVRLPPPGTVLTRPYKGETVQVMVLADGFDYAGAVYPSLTAVARAVTGSHCSGYAFFRLTNKEVRR
jgi:hypothetical protein